MVAGMKDVVAVVICLVGDPFQIGVRSISSEQALALSHGRQDDQTCIVQLPCIARCDALSWTDYVEAHTIGLPPRFFKAGLSIQ